MTMRILSGQKYNLLERGIVTVPTAHAQLPKERLYDGRPSRAHRSAGTAGGQYFKVDGNLLTDGVTNFGGFESWSGGSPAGWTEQNSGTGEVTQETTIKNGGASSAKLSAGTGTAALVRYVVVKSGEIINISSALYGSGYSYVWLQIYNPLTQHYLAPDGTWGAAADYRNQALAAWSVETGAITVENYAACQSDLVSLRVTILNVTSSAVVYADDIYVWPRINFLSVHGHNIDAGAAPVFMSSVNDFTTPTDEGYPPITLPSFYSLLSAGNQDRRYWALYVGNTNSLPIEIGELVIGYARQPLQQFENPEEASSRWDRQANVTPGRERHVHKRSRWQIRNRVFHYRYFSDADYADGAELFHLRPEGDTYPVVIVPDAARPTVIHGRLESTFSDSRDCTFGTIYNDVAVVLSESPFASTAY